MSPKISKEVYLEVKRLYDLDEEPSKIKAYISDQTGLKKTQASRAYKDILESKSYVADTDSVTTFDRKNGTLNYSGTQIKTLPELLEACAVDESLWAVKKWKANKWDTSFKTNEDEIVTVPNFHVTAELEIKKERVVLEKFLEKFKNEAAAFAPTSFVYSSPEIKNNNGKLLLINLPDHHFAKLAYAKETGYDDYDLPTAKSLFIDGVKSLLAKAESISPIDRILFVLGNDLLNFDNLAGSTSAGTPQSNDSRYFKVYQTVCDTAVEVISMLGSAYPTDVVIVRGNHDELSCLTIGEYLKAWFRNHPQVSVTNDALPRKYYRYGNNAFCITHGNEEKHTELPILMATECKFWSDCIYREIWTGHYHTQRVTEYHGVLVRIFPSLCASDNWHSKKGYVGNRRASQALLFDKEIGLDSTFYFYAN